MIRCMFFRLTAAALIAAGVLNTGGSAALAQSKVVVRTDYRFNGYVAPLALAIDRSFYKAAGFDVSIEQGQGSSTTIQTVASGVDNFGLADAATAAIAISSQSVPIKVVADYCQTATMGLIYHPEQDFNGTLSELKGKIIISSAGTADAKLLEPTLAIGGMTLDDVRLQLVDLNARVPLFLQTPGSFQTGFATGDLLRVRARLPGAKYIPYAKYGLVAYGIGLVAPTATIAKSPELVQKFVAASQRGWEEAAKNPDAAVSAALKLYPDLSRDFLLEGLKITLADQLHTPSTLGHRIGWMAEEDWKKTLDVLSKYSGVTPKDLSAYYTNQFIVE
jgi:NitT/TauT family transport system substrate-binding protein